MHEQRMHVAVSRCIRRWGRASPFPFRLSAISWHSWGGREYNCSRSGQASARCPASDLSGFGVLAVLEGFAAAALGAGRLAGNPRQVFPNADGLLVAKAVPAIGHVVVGQRPHAGPTLQQPGSRVLDVPPPRPD